MIPEELRYTEEHEWVLATGEDTVRVGITDYAQEQLGDVVFVQLPEVGHTVAAGDTFGEVESTKSVSDLFSPLQGEVTAVNDSLVQAPDLVNSDPYGEGWMVELRVADPDAVGSLLDSEAYQALVEKE
ncbi:glycine cleavage system H protein [Lentzea fradiae]|uniref:Glycine cleavage system H protein n=1 Tax=Lentzea fradiae TaxID=200378 RepID=A0A1G7UCX9_9PSEU|nr:glycine cleavage system protein GcvH [Lentzea fradiae]SDG44600.1 glycine cleavage system H protein [Lentzea fradiae]